MEQVSLSEIFSSRIVHEIDFEHCQIDKIAYYKKIGRFCSWESDFHVFLSAIGEVQNRYFRTLGVVAGKVCSMKNVDGLQLVKLGSCAKTALLQIPKRFFKSSKDEDEL